jgi:hypothetical protein
MPIVGLAWIRRLAVHRPSRKPRSAPRQWQIPRAEILLGKRHEGSRDQYRTLREVIDQFVNAYNLTH